MVVVKGDSRRKSQSKFTGYRVSVGGEQKSSGDR